MSEWPPLVAYPPIERHGVIGDRRTAALVAADGTLDWLCLPDYDGPVIFGALLDSRQGGYFRLGPEAPVLGRQRYVERTAALVTTWSAGGAELELTDAMAWPERDRPPEHDGRRVVLRRLRCTAGEASVVVDVRPRDDFGPAPASVPESGGVLFGRGDATLGLWTTAPLGVGQDGARGAVRLRAGDAAWAVLALGESPKAWTPARAEAALAETARYWEAWSNHLTYTGPRNERVRRSALTIHLLGYAPAGSLVAAPTTSLPERIGGDRNYDYRYAWVRDASLSLASLSLLGDTRSAEHYMDWLAGLASSTDAPLQVVYRVDGGTDLTQRERLDLAGYQGSRPIRLGNHAFQQRQLDSLGYLADCVLIYQEQGGTWRDEYWDLVRRAADYTAASWRQPDSGIWELPAEAHYVSSKVMSWVTLERAVRLAERLDRRKEGDHWRSTMSEIHAEVMTLGWSERLGAFRERYGSETLDAAALLIPVMGFLPADHPRVRATVDRIVEALAIGPFVHRFGAGSAVGAGDWPVGAFEGAFLPCTFWLATTYALAGRPEEAEAILTRAEAAAGELGLFAEEAEARTGGFLGNHPLLFSHVEYIRAVMELAKARPLDKARLMVGKVVHGVRRLLARGRSAWT